MKIAELFETAPTQSIWYHGSNSKIQEFALSNVSNPDATHQEGPGIYLTSSAEDAGKYGKYIHVLKVKLAKSRTMPDERVISPQFIRGLITKAPDVDDNLANYAENRVTAIRLAVEQIMDAYGPKDYRKALEQVWYDHYYGEEQEWLSRMRSVGFYGFIVKRPEVNHLICFNPKILMIQEVYER